ncbi:hypothetical protein Tco_1505138 [Tanacetum coccineum]
MEKLPVITVLNIIPQQPCNPPKRDDWDTLFQPLFDEYFNPPTIAVSTVLVAAAPRAVEIADSPVSTSIGEDAPSTSIPSTQEQEHSPIIFQGVEVSPKTPLFHEPLHEDSTSQESSSNVRPSHTPFELTGRWTKDHPIANVIGDPSRSVSTRMQLKTDAMWCYFDAFLTSVEQKNFKQAMTEPSWIDAMQEEIHEFERLQVKTDEFGRVLKNKARLVSQGCWISARKELGPTSAILVAAVPRVINIADSPVSMSIDQDAPSTSIPSTQEQEHSLIISQGVKESPKTPLFHDDPLHEPLHEDSTSQGSSSNVRPSHTLFKLIGR